MLTHATDRGDQLIELRELRLGRTRIAGVAATDRRLGRRPGKPSGGDRLGELQDVGRAAVHRLSLVAAHRSTSATWVATRLSPRWTRVRAVTAGMPMIVAMSAYSRSS